MADEEDDRTYVFRDERDERTTEFQPDEDIEDLRRQLREVVEGSGSAGTPRRHLPDGPTMPHVRLPVDETDENAAIEETTNVTTAPRQKQAPAHEERTQLVPRPQRAQRPSPADMSRKLAAPSEDPTYVGEMPRPELPRPPAPTTSRPEPRKPSHSGLQPRAVPPHSPPDLQVRGDRSSPKRPSSPDVTVITEAEPEGTYNKGLVPRDRPRQQVSADVLAEAQGLVSLSAGGADATIIGYATTMSGFHDLEVLGRSVTLKRPRRLVIAISLLLGITMTGALTTTLLQAWTTPERIAVLAASGMFVSVVLSALVGASVWKKMKRGAMVGALSGLVCSLGCAVVAAGWAQEDVRAEILTSWKGYNQTLRDALDDSSALVRATACRQILARGDVDGRQQLLPMLTVSPDAAAQCLENGESEMAIELAQIVAKRWNRELLAEMESQQGPERIAEITAALPALPLEKAEIDLRLLNCTFNAQKTVARDQCAETLGATFAADPQWGSRLGGIAETGWVDGNTSRGIVAMAFSSPSLNATHQKLSKVADATANGNQWSALVVVNEALARGVADAVPELVAALEGKCELDVVKLPQSRDTWFNITSSALAKRKKVKGPVNALCASAMEEFAADAFENASALVAASIRQSGRKEARAIDSGWLMVNPDRPQTQSDLRAMVPDGVSDAEAKQIMRIYSLPNQGETNHPVF